MADHPWNTIPLSDYEGHMRFDGIEQLQAINELTRRRLAAYPARTVAFWGVAGGNGLEHIDEAAVDTVYGIDINPQYLETCTQRHKPRLQEKLTLLEADLSMPCVLPHAALIIADLFVEYLGTQTFCTRVQEAAPEILCCIIQANKAQEFVSPSSPYAGAFTAIAALHTDIDEAALLEGLRAASYRCVLREETPLPNGKSLIRMDYIMLNNNIIDIY